MGDEGCDCRDIQKFYNEFRDLSRKGFDLRVYVYRNYGWQWESECRRILNMIEASNQKMINSCKRLCKTEPKIQINPFINDAFHANREICNQEDGAKVNLHIENFKKRNSNPDHLKEYERNRIYDDIKWIHIRLIKMNQEKIKLEEMSASKKPEIKEVKKEVADEKSEKEDDEDDE